MTPPALLFVLALVLAVAEQLTARGRSLLGWAVIAVAAGLLWGAF